MPQDTLVIYLIVAVIGLIAAIGLYRWFKTRSASSLSNAAARAEQPDLRGTMTRWHH